MTWPLLASALGALVFGLVVRWFWRRGWVRYMAYPKALIFPKKISENHDMDGIVVALLSEDRERLTTLRSRLHATRLGREVFSYLGFPVSPTDNIIRQLQESRAEVVIVDVPSQSAQRAIRSIELIRVTTQQIAIFASGDMIQPGNIVACMRNGASEYVDWSAGHEALLEALTRFTSSRTRALKAASGDPEGGDAAGVAVKKPKRPNLNSGAAAASLDELFG